MQNISDQPVRIVPGSPAYAELWWQWRNERKTKAYNPLLPASVETLRDRLAEAGAQLSDWQTTEEFIYFVEWQGELVGTVSLQNINPMMSYAEIGYGLAQKIQGRGLSKEAVSIFIRQVFAQTQLRRLFAMVAEANEPSCRLLLSLGFQREGVLREHYLVNGIATNQVCFGLLRSEWTVQ